MYIYIHIHEAARSFWAFEASWDCKLQIVRLMQRELVWTRSTLQHLAPKDPHLQVRKIHSDRNLPKRGAGCKAAERSFPELSKPGWALLHVAGQRTMSLFRQETRHDDFEETFASFNRMWAAEQRACLSPPASTIAPPHRLRHRASYMMRRCKEYNQ